MANERKATLLIQLKDQASAGLKNLKAQMKDLAVGFGAAAAAGGALLAFLFKAAIEWGKQEQAVMKLDLALKNAGKSTEGASQRLAQLATTLQKTTGFTDETIIEMQALQATFGLTEAQIASLTPRILDMAAATGVDLQSATVALGRAIQTGSAGALTRYGIVLDEAILKSKNLDAITAALDQRFRGTAATMNNTFLGQVNQLKVAFGELMESIGALVQGPLSMYISKLSAAINNTSDWLATLHEVSEQNVETGRTTAGLLNIQREELSNMRARRQLLIDQIKLIPPINFHEEKLAARRAEVIVLTNRINMLEKAMSENHLKAGKERMDQLAAEREAVAGLEEDWSLYLTSAMEAEIEFTSIYATELQTRMSANRDWFEESASFQDLLAIRMQEHHQSTAAFWANTVNNMVTTFAQGVGQLVAYGGSFKDVMNSIGKQILASFVTEVVQKMVTSWLAGIMQMKTASAGLSFGGPLGLIGGGLLAGFGKKLFSGGVINEPTAMVGLRSGQVGLAGESGVPEALISFPEMGLNSNTGRDALLGGGKGGGGGGGGATVVNIHAGTIVADKMAAKEFAKMIDEELFRLQRNKLSVQ